MIPYFRVRPECFSIFRSSKVYILADNLQFVSPRTFPTTLIPLPATAIAKLVPTRTGHMQTTFIPLHDRLASCTLDPIFVASQVHQLQPKLVRRTHTFVLRVLA